MVYVFFQTYYVSFPSYLNVNKQCSHYGAPSHPRVIETSAYKNCSSSPSLCCSKKLPTFLRVQSKSFGFYPRFCPLQISFCGETKYVVGSKCRYFDYRV
jgi:hypothetical protein